MHVIVHVRAWLVKKLYAKKLFAWKHFRKNGVIRKYPLTKFYHAEIIKYQFFPNHVIILYRKYSRLLGEPYLVIASEASSSSEINIPVSLFIDNILYPYK